MSFYPCNLRGVFMVLGRLTFALLFCIFAKIGVCQQSDDALQKIFEDYHEQYLILFPLQATGFGDSRYNYQLQIHID
mgnify:CR=1 FL=1